MTPASSPVLAGPSIDAPDLASVAAGPWPEPWHVVELNPHAPRPWVTTDLAAAWHAALRAAGIAGQWWCNELPAEGVCCIVGWTPAWLAEQALRLDPRRVVLFNPTPVAPALGERAGLTQAAWLREFGHWVVADLHPDNIAALQARPDGHWHGGTSGAALRAVWLPLPPTLPAPAPPVPAAPDIDVLLYGRQNPQRERVLQALAAAGLRVQALEGVYGAELTPWLQRARLVLHVHAGPLDRLLPWARLLQPLALGVPVVCETCEGAAAAAWADSGVLFCELDAIVDACCRLLADPVARNALAQQGRRFTASMAQQPALRQALQGLRDHLRTIPAAPPLDTQIDRELGLAESAMPPPAGEKPAPITLVQRTPGPNLPGRVVLVVTALFALLMLWNATRR